MSTKQKTAHEQFTEDTTKHAMTVLRDDGLYRHLRFREPGTSMYEFDIVTWPGFVAVTGDMGEMIMSREPDMVAFLRTPENRNIDYQYWAEKTIANDGPKRHWSSDMLEQQLRDHWREHCENRGVETDSEEAVAWWDELKDEIIDSGVWGGSGDEHEQRDALAAWEGREDDHGNVKLSDTWEWEPYEWDYHLKWRFEALKWGILQYDAHKAKGEPEIVAGTERGNS